MRQERLSEILDRAFLPNPDLKTVASELNLQFNTAWEESTARFNQEYASLLPIARRKVDEIIIPWWWEGFEGSEHQGKISDWTSQHRQSAVLSGPIIYPEPPTQKAEGQLIADFIETGVGKLAETAASNILFSVSNESLHEATITTFGNNLGVRILPLGGLTLATATGGNRPKYDRWLTIYKDDLPTLSERLHPEVLIVLAEDIQTGRVLENIANPKLLPTSSDLKKAEDYRRTKQERYAKYLSQQM